MVKPIILTVIVGALLMLALVLIVAPTCGCHCPYLF
jgi:hypothetical protein